MHDLTIDDLIRDLTQPEAEDREPSKSLARARLLTAAATSAQPQKSRWRIGRRGVATIVALLALPTGAAIATELVRDDGQSYVNVSDCPDLLAALQARGLGTDGVVLEDCPAGEEVGQVVNAFAQVSALRSPPGSRVVVAPVVAFGRNANGEAWSISGIAGYDSPNQDGG